MRLVAAVVALLTMAGVFVSTGREFGYAGAPSITYRSTPAGWYFALGDGCLKIGIIDPMLRNRMASPGLFADRSWRHEWLTAWRPFHVDTSCGVGFGGAKYLAIPIWPALLASLAVAAWAHGSLSALSILRSRSCRVCGYDLSGCKDASTPCPECGHAR